MEDFIQEKEGGWTAYITGSGGGGGGKGGGKGQRAPEPR